ncbi:hypothetical protein V5O48_008878 [Marasmius crinis-equi]|uniref:Uncharacterized protein n=1 Tax=Marasmius crinis-equi TaxID=585013 RepID=A0ABR3FCP4_9AGAR
MPSKRSVSSQSASTPARKRVQLDVDAADSEGELSPPVTPTPRKRSSPAKKESSSVAAIVKPKAKTAPSPRAAPPVIELSSDDSDLPSTPLAKKSPAKRPQPVPIKSAASTKSAARATPKKTIPLDAEVKSPVGKPVKKPRPGVKVPKSVDESTLSDYDGSDDESDTVTAGAGQSVKGLGQGTTGPKSTADTPQSEDELDGNKQSIGALKKRPAKHVKDTASGKIVKKPRAVAESTTAVVEPLASAPDSDEEVPPATQVAIKREALRSPINLSAALPKEKSDSEGFIDVEAEEEQVDGVTRSDDEDGSEVGGDDSFINDNVDERNQPVESDDDIYTDAEPLQDSEGLSDYERKKRDLVRGSAAAKGKKQSATVVQVSDDDEVEQESDDDSTTEKRRLVRGSADPKGKKKSTKPVEVSDDDEDQQDSDAAPESVNRRPARGSVVAKGKQKCTTPDPRSPSPPHAQPAATPAVVNTHPVLKPSIQHPDFVEYYATLGSPNLPSNLARMNPYGWTTGQRDEDIEGLDVQAVLDACQIDERTRYKRSVTFTSHQNVFQPGRCDLRQFSLERDCARVRLDNGKGALSSVAVWVTTGVVNRSYLQFPYTPRSTGNDSRDGRTYKIVITPSEQERLIMDAVFGHLLRARQFNGPVWESQISFQSQKPVSEGQDDETPRSPRKSAFTKKKALPVKMESSQAGPSQAGSSSSGVSFFQNLPPNRSFDDRVPVYDGRRIPSKSLKGFGWKERDWEGLPSLPLYEQEVEEDALVTVGYSVSGWRARNSNVPSALFNALFVIVLANPSVPI